MKIFNKVSVVVLTVAFTFGLAGLVRAATTVSLGTADSFAVLAGSAITDTTPSVISGDVGLSPAAGTFYLTPVLTTGEVTGTIYAVDATGPAGAAGNNPVLVGAAQTSLTAAYTNAAGQTPTTTYGPIHDLGGAVLTPGVYNDPSSFAITGTVTLDAGGDPNAVFIFQAGSTLTTASASHVTLINGAQACNVFWQVTSSATLGTGSDFKGNILALQSITDNGGSTVNGRLLARNAAVTLNNTHVIKATCVVPPPPPSGPGAGGGSFAVLPLIDIIKVPNPLALPSGPGSVTYIYTATNLSTVAMHGVWVKDNMCSPVTYVSGDTNHDSMLDVTETWIYNCTKTVSQTQTNTATAHGQANGWDTYDTANATVVVGLPLTPPLIHLVKKPSVFVLPAGGGAVTYTYTVTNPGIVPLNNVSVTDNKCTGLPGLVLGNPGDLNHNGLLDSNETWTFTCQTHLTQTTTNIGTAEGSANGLTAIDFSPATVAVTAPGLPNTGLPPEGNTPWNIIIPTGIFLALFSFYLARKELTM